MTGELPQKDKAASAQPPRKVVHPLNKALEGLTKHYALREGEILKSFRPPHPEERKEFFRVARTPGRGAGRVTSQGHLVAFR